MPRDYLHRHADFADLIRIVAAEKGIDPALVEKDYWIMQSLYGLQQLDMRFELKGGTSLSKGFRIIDRFSEDIDIRIEPPAAKKVATGGNQSSTAQTQSRKDFYGWLAHEIHINGINGVARDHAFDDAKYRSGGIRLTYDTNTSALEGIKPGILLEVGFDDVTPNLPKDISSWAFDAAVGKIDIIDNRALNVACYHPGYTLVEKLQTISTKYRREREGGAFPQNFMRHYYDVYCLLRNAQVQAFIGTDEYERHKQKRFPKADNPTIIENEAFFLRDEAVRKKYEAAYAQTRALYYAGQPSFLEILSTISAHAANL